MSCNNCKLFSPLKEPRDLKVAGIKYVGNMIYGYCFKQKPMGGNTHGYPVYIPDGECKDCEPQRNPINKTYNQLSLFDQPYREDGET